MTRVWVLTWEPEPWDPAVPLVAYTDEQSASAVLEALEDVGGGRYAVALADVELFEDGHIPQVVTTWSARLSFDPKGRAVAVGAPDSRTTSPESSTTLQVPGRPEQSPTVERGIVNGKVVLTFAGFPDEQSILAAVAERRAERHRAVRQMGRAS